MMERRFEDPFVEEIHRIREKLLEECGGDLMDRLQVREQEDSSRVVRDLDEIKATPPNRR